MIDITTTILVDRPNWTIFAIEQPEGESSSGRYSGVRITHWPTSITVECTNYRTREENQRGALKILRAKLYDRLFEQPEYMPYIEHGMKNGKLTWRRQQT